MDLQEVNVLLSVWAVARSASDLLNPALAASGLSADDFAIYSLLAKRGPLTPTELARLMAAPPTTVSSHLARFTRRGDVRKVPNPQDRRSHLIILTPRGRSSHRRAAALYQPILREVIASLGDDEPSVRSALARLRGVLDGARAHETSVD
jgi:DNA-binding MarR family transcriptional regulator